MTVGKGLAALILLLGVVPAAAQERIDLSQAINYALSQNKQLGRAELLVKSAQLREADAKAEFLPNIGPDVTSSQSAGQSDVRYGLRTSQKLILGTLLSVSGGGVTTATSGDVHSRPSIRATIEQPIFRNFGSLIHGEAIRQASSGVKTARRRYELQKADLVLDVVQTYENILRLEQQVHADHESFRRNDALYRVTKAKEGVGKTTRVDTLRVELLRGQASIRLEASQGRLTSIQREFAELLGFSHGAVFELRPTALLDLQPAQPDEAVRVALETRLDYAQVIQDHEDAVRGTRIAKRGLWPDLRATAGYDDFPTTTTSSSGAIPFGRPLWFFGISSGAEFNLSRARIAVDQAQVAEKSASQAIELERLLIERQVKQQLEGYRRAVAELRIAEQNFELAAGRAKLAGRLFTVGRGDNFAVTDAEVALSQAESQLFSARSEASVSAYQLSRVLGTLVEAPRELRPKP